MPRSWLRLPRRTARLRLSLLYAGMFLLSGTAVLVVVYVFQAHSGTIAVAHASLVTRGAHGSVSVVPVPPPASSAGAASNIPQSLVVEQRSADLNRLLGVSWLALAVTTLASALFGWLAAGRVLRPLRTITSTARTISAGNLHERLALAGPNDEFKQLGDTLDDLLGRLEASFEAQRRFVANASHELRTP